MYSAIRKYLVLHNHLSLPNIGNFTVETKPAAIDYAERCVTSSKSNFAFTNNKSPEDKGFYSFLSEELNISEEDALNNFSDFALQLKQSLNESGAIYFEGIGTLTKQTANTILFQPDEIPEYFPAISAEKVIRKNAVHTVRVGEQEKTSVEMHDALQQPKAIRKEKWWVAAAVLAFIGIAMIILYYAIH